MVFKEIKKILIDRDLSIKTLAERIGYSRGHVSNIIHGHFRSTKARQAIAQELGVKLTEIWQEHE
jgi:transcriptional regulator with XRE-family HTH domain